MNHSGDTNKMVSDTPRTDAAYFKLGATMYDLAGEMKRVERELNAANERIKQMEEAGDGLMKSINCGCPYGPSVFNCQTCTNSWDAWRKAKEAKL